MMDRGWRVDGDHHGWPSPGPRQPRPPTQTPMRHPFCWLLQLTNWQAVVWWPTLGDTNDERGDGARGDAGKPQRVGFFKSRVPHGWAVGTITPFLFPFPLSPFSPFNRSTGPASRAATDQPARSPDSTRRSVAWLGLGDTDDGATQMQLATTTLHGASSSHQPPNSSCSAGGQLQSMRGPILDGSTRQHAAACGSIRMCSVLRALRCCGRSDSHRDAAAIPVCINAD